jgi:hypothetical protein
MVLNVLPAYYGSIRKKKLFSKGHHRLGFIRLPKSLKDVLK